MYYFALSPFLQFQDIINNQQKTEIITAGQWPSQTSPFSSFYLQSQTKPVLFLLALVLEGFAEIVHDFSQSISDHEIGRASCRERV